MNKQEVKLYNYSKVMLLDFEIAESVYSIDDNKYLILDDVTNLIDEEGDFEPQTDEDVDGFVYEFGGRWYTQLEVQNLPLRQLDQDTN